MTKENKIVFDINHCAYCTRINRYKTGIYMVALNLFKELLAREDIELSVYVDRENYDSLINFFDSQGIVFNYKNIICNRFLLSDLYSKLRTKNEKYKARKKVFKKVFTTLSLKLLETLQQFSIHSIIKSIEKNDVFFSPIYKIPDFIVGKALDIKLMTMLYDCIPNVVSEYSGALSDGGWFSQLVQSLNNRDYYTVISDSAKADFLKYYPQIDPNKIKTTLLACDDKFKSASVEQIDLVKSKYGIQTNQKYIFSLCTLEARKNLVRTVKTFIEFIKKNEIKDMVFVLGGGHWESFIDILNQEIKSLGDYQDKILKIGYVDDEDLPALYSGAEWFTYTSIYEGFGLPPLEAMSCGCPVITSNNSSLPEVVGDAGIMIDCDSDEQHIEAYEKYYYNEELRKEYAQKGLERAKQFSWKKCVAEMVEVMKECH